MVIFLLHASIASAITCRPQLWPKDSAIHDSFYSIPQGILLALGRESNKQLHPPPHPIAQLSSAGKVNLSDSALIDSRRAIQDADAVAVLALTYYLTRQTDYLKKATEILLSWSKINQPSGNPIDETRLEGMIWAYDLISCDISSQNKTDILNWFERMHTKKRNWVFCKITSVNNHRIHQLKMLLLLDKILNKNWKNDLDSAVQYSTINLNDKSGLSVDYLERNALYYHNYVLQPWLEITLVTGCCKQPVTHAFLFLRNQIITHPIKREFSHSHAKIDTLRAHAGFTYAKQDGTFDFSRTAPTIIAYYTLMSVAPDPILWNIQKQIATSPKILFLKARRILWQSHSQH
jgi:hypothetical protein